MGKTLDKIAEELRNNDKKVQLIYAFNGVGKTMLSRALKKLITPEPDGEDEEVKETVLYYNSFTEDLFYWDNDLEEYGESKLKINLNDFLNWILKVQGQESNIISYFKNYTNGHITPRFSEDYSEAVFSFQKGDEDTITNIKISRGEESNFVWCIFYSLINQVVQVLNVTDTTDRETNKFNNLKYIFIDDPVSSLDDNHLIQLAVDIASLIKKSKAENLKFIITTHNTLFYNVLYNELGNRKSYLLEKNEDNSYELINKNGDSNKSFSYHLHLKKTISKAILENNIEKYHFNLLRNLYEKTANFLGYEGWSKLLPSDQNLYYNRVIQFTNHSTLATQIAPEPTPEEKNIIKFLFNHLINNYSYWKENTDD